MSAQFPLTACARMNVKTERMSNGYKVNQSTSSLYVPIGCAERARFRGPSNINDHHTCREGTQPLNTACTRWTCCLHVRF